MFRAFVLRWTAKQVTLSKPAALYSEAVAAANKPCAEMCYLIRDMLLGAALKYGYNQGSVNLILDLLLGRKEYSIAGNGTQLYLTAMICGCRSTG